jgi:hypothetical protein
MVNRTELSIKPVRDIIDNYKIPILQRLVDREHIANIVKDQIIEYNKYGKFSILQSFTIACLNNKTGYILDGQHRVAMFSELEKLGYNIDNVSVPIVIYNVASIEEVEEYFLKINKHSPIRPIKNLIASGKILFQNLSDIFKHYIKYKEKGCKCNCPYISSFELNENINARNIDDKLEKSNKTIMDLWNSILEVNVFLDNISGKQLDSSYSKKFNDCKNKANKENCNVCYLGVFRRFEWLDLALYALIHSENINAIGIKFFTDIMRTKKRSDIPYITRMQVWKKNTKNISDNGFCYTCNKDLIYPDMECGHIVAHALGGDSSYDNLMAVCKTCNRDMGTMNMEEYKSIISK